MEGLFRCFSCGDSFFQGLVAIDSVAQNTGGVIYSKGGKSIKLTLSTFLFIQAKYEGAIYIRDMKEICDIQKNEY